MPTFVCFLMETTEMSLKGKKIGIIKRLNHASFLPLGRKGVMSHKVIQHVFHCVLLLSPSLLFMKCSFSKQQSYVHISIGKLMEMHLAPSHNPEQVCQVPYIHNIFLSVDYSCKVIWGWKFCLGWGVELHQYKFFIFKILFIHMSKLDAPCESFLITSNEWIGQ